MERTLSENRGKADPRYTGVARVREGRRWLLERYLSEVAAAGRAATEAEEHRHRLEAERVEQEARSLGFDVREQRS